MFTFRFWQYGSCRGVVLVGLWQDPGGELVALPLMYAGGNSPWPTVMPPDIVPELLYTRLLAICRLLVAALNPNQPVAHELLHELGDPSKPSPNRQTTCLRQSSTLRAGWVFALMTLEAAPTPCSRTGFHISSISWWIACTAGT